jgi:hypothetical protein
MSHNKRDVDLNQPQDGEIIPFSPAAELYSREAEQSVLGGLMLGDEGFKAWAQVKKILVVGDFFLREHQILWATIEKVILGEAQPDIITLGDQLEKDNAFAAIGGSGYLGQLVRNTPGTANILAYTKIVRERSLKREKMHLKQALLSVEGKKEAELLTQLKITNDALNQLGKQCGESLFDQLKQSFAEVAAMEFDPVQSINRLTALTREKYPHVAIMLVYHMRKEGSGNWLDTVMGTTGLAGAVDNLMFMRRENAQSDAVFYLTGKDIENECEYAMTFDKVTACWQLQGDAKEYAMSNERREIVDCIKGGITHYKNIAEYLGKKPGTVWKNLKDMANSGQVTPKGKGHYELVDQFTPQCAVDTVDKSLSTTSTDHLPSMVDDGRRESSIKNNGLSDLSTVSTASTDDLSGS